ncbi:LPXTG cell wall anchor domain-containing protein [Gulosibacter macacae]|uniref:LPXTG cell wall anchor domain-containing protein n=1 Tax=Gulosibacter macacae TaxID=2488791 RepID=A0A3P3W0P8_9MICO|nr:LPXTG cell wall anchor domain-containing protein [Gulosibacter macacae]RRJ87456.1 LPXTG cell wall anchor domain-containing protein [Gulosibacter macacae]
MPRIFAGHFSLLVELKLEKSVIDLRDSYLPGDKVRYEFVVTNTGDVTIRELVIVDEMLATANVAVTCDATELAPGAATTCTSAEYTVTDADAAAGTVTNVAVATGSTPSGVPAVSNEADAVITVKVPSTPTTPTTPGTPTPSTAPPKSPTGNLPGTGTTFNGGLLLAGALLVLAGAGVLVRRRMAK